MKKANASPVYMENFVFEVAMTHLTLCFVKIIVFVKHNRTKRKLGGTNKGLLYNLTNEILPNSILPNSILPNSILPNAIFPMLCDLFVYLSDIWL